MRLAIAKFVFAIIFVGWSTVSLASKHLTKENYMDVSSQCKDVVSLNFSNAVMSDIQENFISSPIITCLNLMGNNIRHIGKGAFDKLPNLTHLFLSNNALEVLKLELINFGSHDKLQVLFMDELNRGADHCTDVRGYYPITRMNDKYPNLEVLSLRKNCIGDLNFSPEEYYEFYFMSSTDRQETPFPKLKILDLSDNRISGTNFVKLLPNSLYFLDLHNNNLESFKWNKEGNELFALNLNNNRFNSISFSGQDGWGLSTAGLINLRYLSVSGNSINMIGPNAFHDNDKLLYLDLSANNINDLHPKTFSNLQHLETLNLNINKLKTIPQGLHDIEIRTLCINDNNIEHIFSDTFIQMPKLTTLFLGGNEISVIEIFTFAELPVLEELDLSRNMLSFLPKGWAESLKFLKYLDLSNNKFTLLENLSLTNSLSLIEIYVNMNPIERLNVSYFKSLPQNLTINLVNNSSFASE